MKSYKLTATFAVAICFFSSCEEKTYQCTCVDPTCGVIYPIEATSKKKAQAECDKHQAQAGTGVCTLEVNDN
jgi:hypothetical protein